MTKSTDDAVEGTVVPSDSAQAREAGGEGLTIITFRDEQYSVPSSVEEWPLEVMDSFEQGHSVQFLRGMLSAEDWTRFSKKAKKVKDAEEFTDLVSKAGGFKRAGE